MTESTNPFASSVVDYPQDKLMKIVNSPGDFSLNLVETCKIEASKRGIYSYSPIEVTAEQTDKYLGYVKNLISQHASFVESERYLLNKRLDQEQILSILNIAIRTTPFNEGKGIVNLDKEVVWDPGKILIMIIVMALIIIYIIK